MSLMWMIRRSRMARQEMEARVGTIGNRRL